MQIKTVSKQFDSLQNSVGKAAQKHDDERPSGLCSCLCCQVREHYNDQAKRNNLSVRLIGKQAIGPAEYGYRLTDCPETEEETDVENLLRNALGKVAQCLRDAITIFNNVDTNELELSQLKEILTTYFNLLFPFYPSAVHITM